MTTKAFAILIGIIFIAVGILGYFDNPIVGASGMFHTDSVHNIVHIASGVVFLLVALAAPAASGGFLKFFGIVYLAIGVIGLIQFGTADVMNKEFGFLMVNGKDNLLHIALGIVIFLVGFARRPGAAAA